MSGKYFLEIKGLQVPKGKIAVLQGFIASFLRLQVLHLLEFENGFGSRDLTFQNNGFQGSNNSPCGFIRGGGKVMGPINRLITKQSKLKVEQRAGHILCHRKMQKEQNHHRKVSKKKRESRETFCPRNFLPLK